MDTWGTYTRTSKSADGTEVSDDVLLQADPVNRQRYERKGFTFKAYAQTPGIGPAIQACGSGSAAEQIFGFLADDSKVADLDDNEIVKQAAEVALRKLTGTWTQAEALAEEVAHTEGRLLPEQTEYAIVQGDVLAGYDALTSDGMAAAGSPSPGPTPLVGAGTGADGAGADGAGAPAPAPNPAPTPAP